MAENDAEIVARLVFSAGTGGQGAQTEWRGHAARRAAVAVFLTLLGAQLLIAALHIIIVWPPSGTFPEALVDIVHIDREGNLPTWFASLQFMMLAALFAGLMAQARQQGTRFLWAVCALGALFLSLDEAAEIHERVDDILPAIGAAFESGGAGREILPAGYSAYIWPLVYVPLVLPAVIGVLFLMRRAMGEALFVVFIALCVYLAGAVGLDFLEGQYGTPEHAGILVVKEDGRTFLLDIALMEEFLEMTGLSLAIAVFAYRLRL